MKRHAKKNKQNQLPFRYPATALKFKSIFFCKNSEKIVGVVFFLPDYFYIALELHNHTIRIVLRVKI
jgi:hypothetical protein